MIYMDSDWFHVRQKSARDLLVRKAIWINDSLCSFRSMVAYTSPLITNELIIQVQTLY